jgi:hypothetical protein
MQTEDILMTNLKLTMLAAAAIGTAMIGSASAMPLNGAVALDTGLVHQARIVCNQNGVCWNTNSPRRTWRSSRHNRTLYVQPQYGYQPYYGNQYGYGYRQPSAGISVGPFGIYAR